MISSPRRMMVVSRSLRNGELIIASCWIPRMAMWYWGIGFQPYLELPANRPRVNAFWKAGTLSRQEWRTRWPMPFSASTHGVGRSRAVVQRPFYVQRFFLAKCLRIFKPVESLELNPAHLFSKPVGSSLIFGEPAVRFHLIVEVSVH
jgi:hypothetical protein